MLRVPKISSKPNEVSVFLSSTTPAILWSTPIQNDSIFVQTRLLPARTKTKLLGLYGVKSDEEATAPFSLFRSLSPLPLSRMSSISWTQRFFFYCLISMSMLFQSCVPGSHRLCLTGRLNVFLKTTDTATGCHVEKRKKKVLFLWNEGEREKKSSSYCLAPSPLRW